MAVGDLELLTKVFEAFQGRLAQLILEDGIPPTVEDPAADEAVLVNPAAVVLLIGAPAAGHRQEPLHVEFRGQVDQFRRRDEETMAIGGEIAAGPTCVARTDPSGLFAKLLRDPVVQ